MALALLIERINDETIQADREHEMVPALLEHVQTHSDERASHRIVALLLLLGGNVVIDHMTDVLYNYPIHQQILVYAYLLLGDEGIEALLEILFEPELYDILLGWRYSPQITMLENDLQHEREEHKQNIVKFSQEILNLRAHISDIEEQLEHTRQEHGFRGEELDQANKTIEELQRSLKLVTQEKQSMQDNVQRATQERQTLRNSIQEITREKDALELQVSQWRHYADQLEQGLKLNRPQSQKK